MSLLLRESAVAFNPISDLSCSSSATRHFPSGDLTNLFLFLSSYFATTGVNGFISNISLGSSFGWYFKVTQFELIFLGILMLQMCILRYLEILPVNLNNLFLGDPSGKRRKRRSLDEKISFCHRDEIAESMLKTLKKLDDGECLPFTLCELENLSDAKIIQSKSVFKLPIEVKKLISALKLISIKKKEDNENCEAAGEPSLLSYFADSINLKRNDNHYTNETVCQRRYHACPLTQEDVIHHISILEKAHVFS